MNTENTATNAITIEKKIVGASVKVLKPSELNDSKTSEVNEVKPQLPVNIDPRQVRIERREEGTIPALSRKVTLNTSTGEQKYYIVIGLTTVNGVMDGKSISIERPMEFFITPGQSGPEAEWITGLMRTLSLNARSGLVAKTLNDLRQIKSEESIWFGKKKDGKTRVHRSVISALIWAMQDMLNECGFLTDDYEEQSLFVLTSRFEMKQEIQNKIKENISKLLEKKANEVGAPVISSDTKIGIALFNSENDQAQVIELSESDKRNLFGFTQIGTCNQKDCGGPMVLRDGCPTCMDCGYSKCG